jgi:hypothetical protein
MIMIWILQVTDGATDELFIYTAPSMRVRVCSSVEKHAAVERVEQEDVRALEQAAQLKRISVEGQEEGEDQHTKMGVYELMERKVSRSSSSSSSSSSSNSSDLMSEKRRRVSNTN